MRFWLKVCPKCSGDMELKQDLSGPYVECLQCGTELTGQQQSFLFRLGYVPDGLAQLAPPPLVTEGRRNSA
jgi:hypothetical protein